MHAWQARQDVRADSSTRLGHPRQRADVIARLALELVLDGARWSGELQLEAYPVDQARLSAGY